MAHNNNNDDEEWEQPEELQWKPWDTHLVPYFSNNYYLQILKGGPAL